MTKHRCRAIRAELLQLLGKEPSVAQFRRAKRFRSKRRSVLDSVYSMRPAERTDNQPSWWKRRLGLAKRKQNKRWQRSKRHNTPTKDPRAGLSLIDRVTSAVRVTFGRGESKARRREIQASVKG